MKLSVLICMLLSGIYAMAGEHVSYDAASIPVSLLPNANAVTRLTEKEMIIRSLDEVVEKSHVVITVLNKEGDQYGTLILHSSKLNHLDEVYGYIYDKNGKQKDKIKRSDFSTQNASLQPGFYNDEKIMGYAASFRDYPYTIEFFSTVTISHTFRLPHWEARAGMDCAVEKALLSIHYPADIPVHVHAYNTTAAPVVTKEKDIITRTWAVTDVPAEREEPFIKASYEGSPAIMITPEQFLLDGHKGSARDWRAFGRFIYELNKGRDELTEDKQQYIRELTTGLSDTREKVKALYRYMQNNTRYVLIVYGIGGWQTLDAKFVCNNQYGDCKALSNYMMSMLKAAGITAYPVIISAGRTDFAEMEDSPVNNFNHVIICVPDDKDTIWLECTSNNLPDGYLGAFTGNRRGLMCTPEGGYPVATPVYNSVTNMIVHKAAATCNEDGSLSYDLDNTYTGVSAEGLLGYASLSGTGKDHFIHERFDIPSYVATGYQLERADARNLLGYREQVHIDAANRMQKAGSMKLLNADLVPLSLPFRTLATERKQPFTFLWGYTICDTFTIRIPEHMTVASLPKSLSLHEPFGTFDLQLEQHDGEVIITRKLILKEGTYAPEQYVACEEWASRVTSPVNCKIMLRGKE